MIKDKTLVAALPTAKVLFLSHYSPIQKEKGAYKNTNYPQTRITNPQQQGDYFSNKSIIWRIFTYKKQFIPHYKRIYTTNCRKTRTFANVNQTL